MTATLKHVNAEQFHKCKITSLLASHYNDDGSCACYDREGEKKMELPMHPNGGVITPSEKILDPEGTG